MVQRVADNSPSIPPPRTFRLQISLRMLLALMFLVSVGLTIFRWPWVEVDQIVEYSGRELGTIERRITYRRNWRAEKVKNGRSQSFVENRLLNEENYYEGPIIDPFG